jgi:hypothetical protein
MLASVSRLNLSPRYVHDLIHLLLVLIYRAQSYWYLHEQDASAWTQELDLRPAHEKF